MSYSGLSYCSQTAGYETDDKPATLNLEQGVSVVYAESDAELEPIGSTAPGESKDHSTCSVFLILREYSS